MVKMRFEQKKQPESTKNQAIKKLGGRWDSNPRPPEPQSGVLTN